MKHFLLLKNNNNLIKKYKNEFSKYLDYQY